MRGDDSESGTLILTSHNIARFETRAGGAATPGSIEWLFGGSTWRAIRKEGNTQWLWDGLTGREINLATNCARLYGAPDGRGFLYTAQVDGLGLVWDLKNFLATPLQCPAALLNMAVGDPKKGCWFTDRSGCIYYAEDRQFRLVAKVDDGVGGVLQVCGDYLLWWGMIPHYYPGLGVDQARAFVTFRRCPGRKQPLKRSGERLFEARDGLCLAVDYDDAHGKLILLWQIEGKPPVIRSATIQGFLKGEFADHELQGCGPLGDSRIALSQDGRILAILNSSRELACVLTETGDLIAYLGGSFPFTHVAPGPNGASFWLVRSNDCVYGCTLVEAE